jgi:hypothetical protein
MNWEKEKEEIGIGIGGTFDNETEFDVLKRFYSYILIQLYIFYNL